MIEGAVIHGDGAGKPLGYPTANLDCAVAETKLPDGVYAARATLQGSEYRAALIISSAVKKVEVYLLDYRGMDFYGDRLSVEPVGRVSEIVALTPGELKEKIARDVAAVEGLLLK